MMQLHKAEQRGRGDYGAIRSRHSFSFGSYYDPRNLGVSHLRVLNDDWVAPGAGFPAHGHRDMEIISYVTGGTMEHGDSLGNRFRIEAGQFQAMSAGRGIHHSEFNASEEDPLTFLQIWIEPDAQGLEPGYAPPYTPPDRPGEWLAIAGPDAASPLQLRQDVRLSLARLAPGDRLDTPIDGGRQAYLHVVQGRVEAAQTPLATGDAITVDEPVTLEAREPSQVLWFDLPA